MVGPAKLHIFLIFIQICVGQTSDDANSFCFQIAKRRNQRDLYADAADCHSFYQCFYLNETTAIGYRHKCPAGTFWHDLHLQCVPENSDTPCTDLCRDDDVAMLGCYADSTSCDGYFVCSNDVSYKFCCPPRTRFNADDCTCIDDAEAVCNGTCRLPTAPPTTVQPSLFINETLCRDSYGAFLSPVNGNPTVFQVVDLENADNSRVQSCAHGTGFSAHSCACDLKLQFQPADARQCSLYLPFDGDAQDDSRFKAATTMVGNAEISYIAAARGTASLKVFGGWLEVPAFKGLDLGTSGSWCFFYRCGLDPNVNSTCTTAGGLISNNANGNASEFSIIIASTPTDRIEARLAFKQPKSQSLVDGDLGQRVNGPDGYGFQQVCLVHDDFMTYLYINNRLVSSAGTDKRFDLSHAPLAIGSDQLYGDFEGFIDEVLFCNFKLSAEEVRAHYQGNDALVDAGLIPEYNRRASREAPKYGTAEEEWPKWCETFDHDPADVEGFEAFKENLEIIKEHNRQFELGLVATPQHLNKFSADTSTMAESRFGLSLPMNWDEKTKRLKVRDFNCAALPAQWDWVDKKAVLPPLDQKECGACWAFVAAATVEAQLAMHKDIHDRLSVQQLMDCSKAFKNRGCRGGLMTYAYQYLSQVPGLMLFDDYPYQNAENPQCLLNTSLPLAGQLFNHIETAGDDCLLAYTLMTHGPLGIGMECKKEFLNHPPGHIYRNNTCRRPKARLNHAMTLVGFGTDPVSGLKYFKIKNSWGTNWGEGGYIRVARDDPGNTNICGIADLVSGPILTGVTSARSAVFNSPKDEIIERK